MYESRALRPFTDFVSAWNVRISSNFYKLSSVSEKMTNKKIETKKQRKHTAFFKTKIKQKAANKQMNMSFINFERKRTDNIDSGFYLSYFRYRVMN